MEHDKQGGWAKGGGTHLTAIGAHIGCLGRHLEPANFVVIRSIAGIAVAGAANDALVVNGLDDDGMLLCAEGAHQLRLEQVLALRQRLRLRSLQTDRVLEIAGDAATRRSSEEPKGCLGAKCGGCGAKKSSGCQHDAGCPVMHCAGSAFS